MICVHFLTKLMLNSETNLTYISITSQCNEYVAMVICSHVFRLDELVDMRDRCTDEVLNRGNVVKLFNVSLYRLTFYC